MHLPHRVSLSTVDSIAARIATSQRKMFYKKKRGRGDYMPFGYLNTSSLTRS